MQTVKGFKRKSLRVSKIAQEFFIRITTSFKYFLRIQIYIHLCDSQGKLPNNKFLHIKKYIELCILNREKNGVSYCALSAHDTKYTNHFVSLQHRQQTLCFSLLQTVPKESKAFLLSLFYIQQVYFLYPATIYNSLSSLHLLLHTNTLRFYLLIFSIKEILYQLRHHCACDIKYSFMCILIKVLKMKYNFGLPKNLGT